MKVIQNNGDFAAKECQAVMKYLSKRELCQKIIYSDVVTVCDKRPSYSTVRN
jgi:hypothetical protein